MEFQWDSRKESENVGKHGVSFVEAIECFMDPDGFALADPAHSSAERRFYWIRRSSAGRVLTVRYTRRGAGVRIIGAAEWRRFRDLYHERTQNR
jgi:hypothetical protein